MQNKHDKVMDENYIDFKQCKKNGIKTGIINILNKLDVNYENFQNGSLDEIQFMGNDNIERRIVIPNNLYNIIFKDINDLKEQLKNIVEKLNGIIFAEPFSILFGRIDIYQPIKKTASQDINGSFYNGFDIEAYFKNLPCILDRIG